VLTLFVNGSQADFNRQGTVVEGAIQGDGPLVIGQRANKANHFTDAAIQDLRVYARGLDAAEVRTLSQLPDLRADAATPVDKRRKDRLTTFFLETLDPPYREVQQKIQQMEADRKAIEGRATITHVQEEKMNSKLNFCNKL
jgi:hypothetical protein